MANFAVDPYGRPVRYQGMSSFASPNPMMVDQRNKIGQDYMEIIASQMNAPRAAMPDFQIPGAGGVGSVSNAWSGAAGTAANALTDLLSNPSKFYNTDIFKNIMAQGTEAVNRQMAGRGMFNSGNRAIELQNLGQNEAFKQFFPMAQLLSGISQQGAASENQMFNNALKEMQFKYGIQQGEQERMDKQYQQALSQTVSLDPMNNMGLRAQMRSMWER